MKKYLLLLLFFLTSIFAADYSTKDDSSNSIIFSSNKSRTNSLYLSFGVDYSTINATSKEIVYDNGSQESLLYWRLKDVKLLGVSGSLSFYDKIVLNASYKKNIANPTSTMDDYDWIEGYTTSSEGYTNWSHHENTKVKDVSKLDLNIQGSIFSSKIGTLYAMLGYKEDTFKWHAKGGFYEYSSYNFQRIYIDDDEDVISYNQYIKATYLGLKFVNKSFRNLTLGASFKYSNNVKINDEDTHYQRTGRIGFYKYNGIYFQDYCDGGTLSEFEINASYQLFKGTSIYLGYNYTNIDVAKGYTKITYMGTPYSYTSDDGTAGSSYESKMTTFGIKVRF